jgi:uncharacterized membrane protein YgcG
MDNEQIGGGSTSFFSYMFSLNPNEKNDLLNMIQYVVLAIIPIIVILKLMKKYIPPDNDKKASIEILIEVVVQLIVIFAAFWFIHKLIMFIPTYSKSPYPHFNLIQVVIPIVFILFSMNSTISEKANTLLNRAMVVVGLSKENYDEEEQAPKKVAVIPPSLVPMVSNMEATRGIPTYDQRQDPTFPPSGYQGGGNSGGGGGQVQQMQFQMNEPVAANEMVMGSMF